MYLLCDATVLQVVCLVLVATGVVTLAVAMGPQPSITRGPLLLTAQLWISPIQTAQRSTCVGTCVSRSAKPMPIARATSMPAIMPSDWSGTDFTGATSSALRWNPGWSQLTQRGGGIAVSGRWGLRGSSPNVETRRVCELLCVFTCRSGSERGGRGWARFALGMVDGERAGQGRVERCQQASGHQGSPHNRAAVDETRPALDNQQTAPEGNNPWAPNDEPFFDAGPFFFWCKSVSLQPPSVTHPPTAVGCPSNAVQLWA